MREFRALQVPDLTADVAATLETSLKNLSGVEGFNIIVDSQELYIIFNEKVLSFQALAHILVEAGCPLRNMRAVLIQ